ncbi:putative sarcosine oxidase [Corynespora cassiicola Philippines]|uniref:Putative sarcosine oxidase n=1 Tax=Corynespora cassiicola Philippines TaxID=1448308 RepID=A0A2T2N8J5_CORCC|nr:putative sarcosine oxidase [Corynespora cassiicola Philippines]
MTPTKESPINIVGAGIFGLSTALHLARRGYKNVTVFDKQPYDKTRYSYFLGCDAASADLNKIIRSGYGSQVEYQEITFEAIAAWKQWNEDLASGKDLPPGLTSSDRVFFNCGHLGFSDADTLTEFELATLKSMEEQGHADTQFDTTNPKHIAAATSKGINIDPLNRATKGKRNAGLFDSTGGVAVADKACFLALHKARRHGARFVLDPVAGAFADFIREGSKITGITTKDGKQHLAALTIMACGGWTPSLLPQLDGLCETTAGSVVMYKIPRESKLWDRFAPGNLTTYMWKERGIYGFPRDENGYLKIGYRGTKYTNPKPQADGVERSIPVTRWTEGEKLTQIPQQAMDELRDFVDEYFPELKEEGIDIAMTRVCWYNDSFDNHLLVDYVPEREGLFVATAGSGHAFKYLPNIGNWVVDVIEDTGKDRPAIKAWKWRALEHGQTPVNVLMEGKNGPRALGNVKLVDEKQARDVARARL